MYNPDRVPIGSNRGGNGKFSRSADTAARDGEACRLRTQGLTYAQVAAQLGYHDASHARQGVERAMTATLSEPAEALRQLELLKLDQMSAVAWRVLDTPHPLISAGKNMMFDGVALTDPMPTLHAIDRLLRIAERRAKLCGLDSPIRVGVLSPADIDVQIAVIEAELAARPDPDPDDD